MIEQGSPEWLKMRLGRYNGSEIGNLMTSGKKDAMFGKSALSYIYKVASERDLLKAYIDDPFKFEIYMNQVSVSNKFMEWGKENEDFAAETYHDVTGFELELCSSIPHPAIPNFSASPDRIATDENGNRRIVEIKCPKPETLMQYKAEVRDGNSLKLVNSNYFYQVQAEMACAGLDKADFVVFCPFLKHYIHIVTITRDEAVIEEFAKRIKEADRIIGEILFGNGINF